MHFAANILLLHWYLDFETFEEYALVFSLSFCKYTAVCSIERFYCFLLGEGYKNNMRKNSSICCMHSWYLFCGRGWLWFLMHIVTEQYEWIKAVTSNKDTIHSEVWYLICLHCSPAKYFHLGLCSLTLQRRSTDILQHYIPNCIKTHHFWRETYASVSIKGALALWSWGGEPPKVYKEDGNMQNISLCSVY